MAHQQIFEGTPAQLAGLLGNLSSGKRYRLMEVEEPQSAEEPAPNQGMIAALQEIAERQKGRRYTDGSQTERMLREGRAGAMWGYEPSE